VCVCVCLSVCLSVVCSFVRSFLCFSEAASILVEHLTHRAVSIGLGGTPGGQQWADLFRFHQVALTGDTPPTESEGASLATRRAARWLRDQRDAYKEGQLSEEQVRVLDAELRFPWRVVPAALSKDDKLTKFRNALIKAGGVFDAVQDKALKAWWKNVKKARTRGDTEVVAALELEAKELRARGCVAITQFFKPQGCDKPR
jgi:hypothetical protein